MELITGFHLRFLPRLYDRSVSRIGVVDYHLSRQCSFSRIDWFIGVLVVVAELESHIYIYERVQLNRNFLGGNVLEKRRDYHLFEYCLLYGSRRSYRTIL